MRSHYCKGVPALYLLYIHACASIHEVFLLTNTVTTHLYICTACHAVTSVAKLYKLLQLCHLTGCLLHEDTDKLLLKLHELVELATEHKQLSPPHSMQGITSQLQTSHATEMLLQAKPSMTKSSVVDNETGKSMDSTVRTSTGTFFGRGQDEVLAAVEKRIAQVRVYLQPCIATLSMLLTGLHHYFATAA